MKCDNCEVRKLLTEALEYERERNRELQERLMAVANPMAYQSFHSPNNIPSDKYFGVGSEEYVEFDDFGQKIIVKKDEETDH